MQKLNQIILTALLLAFMAACSSNQEEAPTMSGEPTIVAKWNIDNSDLYMSFEFNSSNNYVIVQKAPDVAAEARRIYFGNYEVVESYLINLEGFGTMIISDMSTSSINFSIRVFGDSENQIVLDATRQEDLANSERTEMLNKTWRVVTLNGVDVSGTDDQLTVMWSKAGTYLVSNQQGATMLAQWKWKNAEETEFLYTFYEVPVWNDEDFVRIEELSENYVRVVEDVDGEIESWELEPLITN
jgi:hypothetical protein